MRCTLTKLNFSSGCALNAKKAKLQASSAYGEGHDTLNKFVL